MKRAAHLWDERDTRCDQSSLGHPYLWLPIGTRSGWGHHNRGSAKSGGRNSAIILTLSPASVSLSMTFSFSGH